MFLSWNNRMVKSSHATPSLPYINQVEILNTLDAHVKSNPLKHVLLLWGAKSTGKTGALILKAAEWEKKGHPVIEVDLKGFDGTLASFANMLHNSTVEALEHHNRDWPDELYKRTLKIQKSRALASSRKSLQLTSQALPSAFTSFLKSLPLLISLYATNFLSNTRGLGNIAIGEAKAGPWFSAVVKHITIKMTSAKEADFRSMFILLEDIAHLQITEQSLWQKLLIMPGKKLLPPIVIIREIQRLDNLKDYPELGRRVFEELFEYFETRKQGQSRVPIIIETSDFLWSRMKQLLSSQESFLPSMMTAWKKEDAEQWLVKKQLLGQSASIFTQAEFDKVWDFSGGHAGTVYFLHSYLIAGRTLDDAIDIIQKEAYSFVRSVTFDKTDISTKNTRINFLKNLQSNKYYLQQDDFEQDPTCLYFLQSNILFYDGKGVFPQKKTYQNAIDELLIGK